MPEPVKPRIYAVATTHLDTSWSWELETTLQDYLPKTLTENFELLEKYPDYVFSFEGAYRYELMEEYYPELFEKLKEYIAAGRWHAAGSAYENGDVNIPSPEALFRNILYGTDYFKDKFDCRSEDIYLPDCFGFGWALPSITAHSNLKGFITQKLVWSGAYGVPFDLGVWRGPDGAGVYAAPDVGDYNRSLTKVRKKGSVARRLRANIKKYDLPFTLVLHGIGDRGGAPREKSVKAVLGEARVNSSHKVDVIPAHTDQLFRDMDSLLTVEQKARLPVWANELVMTDHGVGCYTSRTVGKRLNRRGELLGDAAERAACTATVLTKSGYPAQTLDTAWKRIVAHQFHDDITGTSSEVCCKRNWNDYILSLNQFAEEYRRSMALTASAMDTSFVKGTALAVNNPVQSPGKRAAAVQAVLPELTPGARVRVYNSKGEEVPAQREETEEKGGCITFLARVPSVGSAVYDVREDTGPCKIETGLKVTTQSLENEKYIVTLNDNGDIEQIFDKNLGRELLSSPIRLALHDYDGAGTYPAWELTYKEVSAAPREFAANPEFKILENGPARVAVEVVRRAADSTFKQVISLDTQGDRVDVYNEVDWCSYRSLLKVEFPFTAANRKAGYDLGLGVIERGNSRPSLYEVPAVNWADITDTGGEFGVSVFSDSRTGWDKPADNTLRLTAVHSPRGAYRDAQHLLDFGLNRFSFAVYSHPGSRKNGVQRAALEFVQPVNAFKVPVAAGVLGAEYSLCGLSDENVIIRAIKKAQNTDEIIVRLNEGEGENRKGVRLRFAGGISSAREVWATEEPRSEAEVEDGELVFDIKAFEPKTFALTVKDAEEKDKPEVCRPLTDLPFNLNAVTANGEALKDCLPGNSALPEEIFPKEIVCGGIGFLTGRTGRKNAIACRGQSLSLPEGCDRLHLVAAAFGEDREAEFFIDGESVTTVIHSAEEAVGAWDLFNLNEAGYIKKPVLAWNSTHAHGPEGDIYGKQLYFFKYSFNIPPGAKNFTLPEDEAVVVLAATATSGEAEAITVTELYDSLEKRELNFAVPPERDFAAKNNKWGHRRSRLKFLFNYAKRRVNMEMRQMKRASD